MPYPDSVLRPGEHVLAHRRPHWRMLVVPALVVPVTAFLAAFVAAAATGLTGTPATVARIAVLVVAAGVVVRFAVMPLLRWRCTRFVVTDRRLLIREGVLSRESIDVPGASITAVRTRATGSERMVGCGTLVVATASAGEPWEFAGLGGVERLAAVTEEMAEDRGGLHEPPVDDEDDDWGAWSDDDAGPGDDDAEEPADELVAAPRVRRRRRAGRTSR